MLACLLQSLISPLIFTFFSAINTCSLCVHQIPHTDEVLAQGKLCFLPSPLFFSAFFRVCQVHRGSPHGTSVMIFQGFFLLQDTRVICITSHIVHVVHRLSGTFKVQQMLQCLLSVTLTRNFFTGDEADPLHCASNKMSAGSHEPQMFADTTLS